MKMGRKQPQGESGQTAILFAIMIIGLLAFVGLAVDGGSVFTERRVVQNAADSAAFTGVHYIFSSNAPSETRLREVVNSAAEANGVPDTDGNPGNAVNDNINSFYTDSRGSRLPSQPCYIVPCGSIPTTARGLEVTVGSEVSTYFLGVIDLESLDVGASAVAVASGGGGGGGDLGDNALVAFGSCSAAEKPLDMSASNVDIIGNVYSSTWFENRGDNNHYHGQVYYGDGYGYIDTASPAGVYEPNPPGEPQPITSTPGVDPLAGLFTVADFDCTSGSIGSTVATCYDLTVHAPDYGNKITTQLLRQRSPDGTTPFLDPSTNQLREGLYYGGPYPFIIGQKQMVGTVTLVTSNIIKITENDIQLTGYLDDNTVIPGLLFFSSYTPAAPFNECTNHEDLVKGALDEEPINTTGNAGTIPPGVYHGDDKAGCVDLDQPSNCYELGSLQYIGLIYAPNGRVATSGDGATYIGAIVAPSIRVNGFGNRSEGSGTDPDRVGALFVRDANLFPETELTISLDR